MPGRESTNFIFAKQKALPDELCDQLIELFETHPGVVAGTTSGGVDESRKLSRDLNMNRFDELAPLRQQITDLSLDHFADYFLKFPIFGSVAPKLINNKTGEEHVFTMHDTPTLDHPTMMFLITQLFRVGELNIQRYNAGEGNYLHWHSEIFADPTFEALHRLLFFIYYLNDVGEGGETEFYFQTEKVRPEKGTVLIAPAGFTHTHRGLVPMSNDKYVLTSWLLYNRKS